VRQQLAGGEHARRLTESALHTSAVALTAVESFLHGAPARPVDP
jgi:hypothetical protein